MIGRAALFTPANIPGMINATVAVGSDSIIFDLEDSVPLEEKDAARILLREALKSLDFLKEKKVIIRVNEPTTDFFDADIAEVVPLGNYPLILPKASVASIVTADKKLKKIEGNYGLDYQVSLIPTIETPLGIESVNEILKSSGRITGVNFGAEDFTTEMGVARLFEDNQLLYARSRIAIAARAADVEAMDTPFPDIDDIEGLKKEATIARQLGFTGKMAIHPSQIDTIHGIFTPPQQEIDNALKIVKAFAEAEKVGKGAVVVDGKMVDLPVFRRAQMVLRKSGMLAWDKLND
ncbi:HpcH/HpaI aldolase/citrate lyase family protein [Chloroflexota bacterium]